MIFENDWELFKIQMKIALKEKFYFVYTFVVPVFMVFLNKTLDFRDNESLYVYWSYIVVTTAFNGFLINILRLREGGFFKTLSYLVESRHSIVLANILVQMLVIQFEILMFNLIVTIFIAHISVLTFIYGFLVTFLTTLVTISILSIVLLLKMRQEKFNILVGSMFTIGVLLLGVHPTGLWEYILTVLNPFQFVYGMYVIPCSESIFRLVISGFILIYLVLGVIIFKDISIERRLS